MEKEEFLFILESIKDLNTKGEPASRRSISELSENSTMTLSPQQVRNRLDYLEKMNYVTKGRGRAGTKITLEGLSFCSHCKTNPLKGGHLIVHNKRRNRKCRHTRNRCIAVDSGAYFSHYLRGEIRLADRHHQLFNLRRFNAAAVSQLDSFAQHSA